MTAHDDPGETPEEVTRRTFMANATMTIGGIIGVVLAVPIVGSLIPSGSQSKGSWSPLTADELKSLETATSKPVKMSFTLKFKDGYLPEQAVDQYVWGIKIDEAKFKAARPDIYQVPNGNVTYPAVNMGFVVFSPICPHLGCRFNWSADADKFLCPCHGSQYNFDGTHVAGPAPRGLDPLPFQEQSGTAQVTWIMYQTNTPARIVISYQA
ncbi:MAG TPA: ubiquinol-cytochrome c reductase iron-sulfur subunit [Candidatus Acidoferrales bacterium]|nr:ubiquinol-cytochrome c reductase iron-sulfur subunit [Candidatus Acidoferrales bacterium]